MVKEKEEMLLLKETCFAVKKSIEEGEECFYAVGELYEKYNDPDLHPYYRNEIKDSLMLTSFVTRT